VVSGDPATFRVRHGVPFDVPIFGPYSGVLQDGGERLQLLRPDNPDIGEDGQPIVPEIVVDEVRYDNSAPWPTEAAGSGASIERIDPTRYGDDPVNWRSSPGVPSPGLPNSGNRPPQVQAGADQVLDASTFPVIINLDGAVTDDGEPNPPGALSVTWSQVSGPGVVWFESPGSASTSASLPGVGTYVLRLTASDGALQTSGDLIVTITRTTSSVTLVAQGSVWKYLDTGTDLPAGWISPGYNDATWPSGAAKLGYGDGDEATVISFGPDPNNKHVTTFFRRAFQVTSAASISNLKVGLRRDDGGIVYLNGTEIFRSNMPEGDIAFSTLASGVVGDLDERTFYERAVDPTLLVEGNNVLAVRVHQVNLSSSDLGFDLYLTGTSFPSNAAPGVQAGADQSIVLPSQATLDGQATDDGLPIPPGQLTVTWSQVDGPGNTTFANPLASRTSVAFNLPGTYTLRLTATDGAFTIVDDVTIDVGADPDEAYNNWKTLHFTAAELLDPAISGDGVDPDDDGHVNYEEYLADTDPWDAESVLKIVQIEALPGNPPGLEIRFNAVAGRSYSLQSRSVSPTGAWLNILQIPTQSDTGILELSLPSLLNTAPRFYRVVTPQQP
jgi:hypothetical protein